MLTGCRTLFVKRGFIDVWDKPGLGVTLKVEAPKAHLADEVRRFFDETITALL